VPKESHKAKEQVPKIVKTHLESGSLRYQLHRLNTKGKVSHASVKPLQRIQRHVMPTKSMCSGQAMSTIWIGHADTVPAQQAQAFNLDTRPASIEDVVALTLAQSFHIRLLVFLLLFTPHAHSCLLSHSLFIRHATAQSLNSFFL